MKKLKGIALFFTIWFMLTFAGTSFAREQHQHNGSGWEPISAGPITTWTAPLCGKDKFVIQPFLFYNRTRGVFNSDTHYDSLPNGDKKYQFQQQLFVQYGLTDKWEIDAQTVYQENYIKQSGQTARASGFGDSYIFTRWCAIEEEGRLPHLVGLIQLKIPTGKYQHAHPKKLGTDLNGAVSGGGSYDPGFGLNLTKKVKPFVFHADAIYSSPRKVMVDGVKTRYANYSNYDFSVEYFFAKNFNLMFEVNGFSQGDKWQDSVKIPSSNISYLANAFGIGWSNDKIQLLLVYQRTILGTNADANDSAIFTLVHTF